MLVFGKAQYLNDFKKQFPKSELVVFNFSFIGEGYEILDLLPRERFNIDDSQEFDIAYANYILNDNYRFSEFMKIIYPLYEGKDVFVLISNTDFFDILNESVSKLIQQRYGYISNEVHSSEDIEYIREGTFTIQGLYNLDMDKERVIRLSEGK